MIRPARPKDLGRLSLVALLQLRREATDNLRLARTAAEKEKWRDLLARIGVEFNARD
jgi:hypothetical protein